MPVIAKSKEELINIISESVSVEGDLVNIKDEKKLRDKTIDDLIYTAVFSEDEGTKEEAKG